MAMDPCDASPLLLLLLLRVLLLGLLVFLEKAGPFFVRGKLFVGRQHRIGRGHPDAHLQLGFSGSFHGAYSRGYVGVIAPDRRSNVSAAHNQVVGRVETHPSRYAEEAPRPTHAWRPRRSDPRARHRDGGSRSHTGMEFVNSARSRSWYAQNPDKRPAGTGWHLRWPNRPRCFASRKKNTGKSWSSASSTVPKAPARHAPRFQNPSPAHRVPAKYGRNRWASACPSNPPDRSWHRVRPMRQDLASPGVAPEFPHPPERRQ